MVKKLTRNPQDKMVAGVASGLAQYFQLEVTWVRIAFALAVFFGGSGILIYIILWIVMPEKAYNPFQYTDYRVNSDEPTPTYNTFEKPKSKVNASLIGGLILIGLGSYFLLREFDIIPDWFSIRKLWPLVLIGFGLSILLKKSKESSSKKPFDTSEFDKMPEDAKPEEVKPEEVKPEEVKSEEVKPDETNKNTTL